MDHNTSTCVRRFPTTESSTLWESFSGFGLAFIVTEGLFIEVSEKMERLKAPAGSLDGTFQEASEVFQPIRVDVAIDVLFRVVNNLSLIHI